MFEESQCSGHHSDVAEMEEEEEQWASRSSSREKGSHEGKFVDYLYLIINLYKTQRLFTNCMIINLTNYKLE